MKTRQAVMKVCSAHRLGGEDETVSDDYDGFY